MWDATYQPFLRYFIWSMASSVQKLVGGWHRTIQRTHVNTIHINRRFRTEAWWGQDRCTAKNSGKRDISKIKDLRVWRSPWAKSIEPLVNSAGSCELLTLHHTHILPSRDVSYDATNAQGQNSCPRKIVMFRLYLVMAGCMSLFCFFQVPSQSWPENSCLEGGGYLRGYLRGGGYGKNWDIIDVAGWWVIVGWFIADCGQTDDMRTPINQKSIKGWTRGTLPMWAQTCTGTHRHKYLKHIIT